MSSPVSAKRDNIGENVPVRQVGTNSASAVPVSPVESFVPYRNYNPDPCYRSKSHDVSDLCAQWRGAIAAEKSAREARRATTWSIVATILSAIAVAGLITTIWQTRGALGEARRSNLIAQRANARATRQSITGARDTERALEIAERNASAASGLVAATERNAQKQLRAYLAVTNVVIRAVGPNALYATVQISNLGSTPARIKKANRMAWIGPITQVRPHETGPDPIAFRHIADLLSNGVPANIFLNVENILPDGWPSKDVLELYLYGRVEYADVFGEEHWMTFAFRLNGYEVTSDSTFTACIYGNGGS